MNREITKQNKRNDIEISEEHRLRLAALIDEYDSNESWVRDMRWCKNE